MSQLRVIYTFLLLLSFSFSFSVMGYAQTTQTYCSTNVPVSIPDNSSTTSVLNVPDSGLIDDVVVKLQIDHSFRTDAEVSLTSPDNTRINLFNDVGGSGDDFGTTCDPIDFILDDEAMNPVTNINSPNPSAGTWRPETPLSTFDNESKFGQWTLSISDDSFGFGGTLNCWCLEITTLPPAPTFLFKIPNTPELTNAIDVDVDSSGNIYVLFLLGSRVAKLDSAGNEMFRFGRIGAGNLQFNAAEGIAVDSMGNIYVADRNNNRIQIFDSDGTFLRNFGSFGTGDGQLSGPEGIAVKEDTLGNIKIYVADTFNNRIQIFDSDGNFEGKISGFSSPNDVEVDDMGNIYVADRGNNRIRIYDSNGTFLRGFGSFGTGDAEFNAPQGIKVDSMNNIYVADTGNDRIKVFDSTGNFQFMFGWGVDDGANAFQICNSSCQAGISGSGDGQFDDPRGVALDAMGNIYVTDRNNDRIQKFDSSGVVQSNFRKSGTNADGQFIGPEGIAVDALSNIYVADTFNDRIQKFDSSGAFQLNFGTNGTGDGEFNKPEGVAVDAMGNIYVTDTSNHRIQIFDSSGVFQSKIGKIGGGSGSGNGEFNFPVGIAVDASGNIYVVDSVNSRVQIFNSSGVFQSKFGTDGNGDGNFNFPEGLALDTSGNIYVADTFNNRIQKFNSSGNFQFMFGWGVDDGANAFQICNSSCQTGISGSGDGQFNNPGDVTVDTSGNIYVADSDNDRIQKFDSSGMFLEKFGTSGTGDGQFDSPGGIAVYASGNIYVADTDNDRIQVFFQAGCGNMIVEDMEECDEGTANGTLASCCSSTCEFEALNTECRASAGACDPAELCDGSSSVCPADILELATIVCRAAVAGGCDIAEMCTGSSVDCPDDTFAPDTTVCRAAAGICDVAESCTGSSATCPANVFASASTQCRASAGVCDVAESCTGSSANCPTDGFDTGTECRASAGVCDVAESCDGSSATCPTDGFDTGTECRASVGVCDVAESCDGSGAACPTDGFEPATKVCNASTGICDTEETCTGSSADCPDNVLADEGTECRASNGLCDIAESCDGLGAECPVDEFVDNETICRAASNSCDVEELCPGDGALCPEDAFEPEDAVCEAEVGPDGLCKNNSCVNEGVITIVKVANPRDGTDFEFGCSDEDTEACEDLGDSNGIFTLDDEPEQTDDVDNTITSDLMFVGLYMIEELLPEGWQLDQLECVNDEDGESVLDPDNNMVMVDLDPEEDITCTFFNSSVTDTGEFLSVDLDLETITTEPAEMVSISVDVTNPASVTSSLALTRQTAEGVMFTVEIPEGFTIEELSTSQGDCDIELLECDLGDIEPGETVTITVEAVVPEGDGVYRVSFIASTSSGQEFSGTATVNVQSEDSGTGVTTGGSGGNGGCAVAADSDVPNAAANFAILLLPLLVTGIWVIGRKRIKKSIPGRSQ